MTSTDTSPAEEVTGELAPKGSPEKVHAAIQGLIGMAESPSLQVFLKPLMARFQLPEDPQELDGRLLELSRLLLQLRSDDAPAYSLVALDLTVAQVHNIQTEETPA